MSTRITDRYKQLSEIEHILQRPGMWIGSTSSTEIETSVFEDGSMVEKSIEYIPGLLKLFDEIISNSVDEYHRRKNSKRKKDRLTEIKITLDNTGHFTCYDDGGIPVEYHEDAKCYVPEMIFSNLRAGSNFNDDEKREGVGTNGVGSTIANIFSKKFIVETADGKNKGIIFWSNNMHEKTEFGIKKSSDSYTKIISDIEISRFNLTEISKSFIQLLEKRCIIAAASNPGLIITFNDETFKFNSFKDYVDLYGFETIGEKNDDWEFYVASVPSQIGGKSYGIVNSAECDTGTHQHHLDNMIYLRSDDILRKRHKIDDVKRQLVKSHTITFINITVPNPTYDSQSKDKLTTDLGYAFYDEKNNKKRWPACSKKTTNKIKNSALIDMIYEKYHAIEMQKERQELEKFAKESRKKSSKAIRKLIEANAKGKKQREKCELWLFEGDSAASNFRPSRNPQYQAAYKLKGKVRNTLSMSGLDIMKNQELSDIITASNLDITKPDEIDNLRFGKFVIATDMDHDGDCINGQLLTFFSKFPKLIEAGIVVRAISPIVKASKGKKSEYFYSIKDYEEFLKTNKGWSREYFKGLGSLEQKDFKEMMRNPRFEVYGKLEEVDMKTIKAWMGKDSSVRKELLK